MFYKYQPIQLGATGLQCRMHEVEKINCYLTSDGKFEFLQKLCNDALKAFSPYNRQSVSGAVLSKMNLVLAIKETVEAEAKNIK